MAHALTKELEEIVKRAEHLRDVGQRLDETGEVSWSRNRKHIDLDRLEALLSEPSLTVSEACEQVGIDRNTLYYRKQKDATLRAVFNRAMQRRRENPQFTMSRKYAGKKGQPKHERVSALEMLVRKMPDYDPAWPDEVKAKWMEAYARLSAVAAKSAA